MAKLHKLKLRIEFADDVLSGEKCFEVGDSMNINRYHKLDDVKFAITYVLSGWGIKDNYVVFGIRRIDNG